MVEAKQIQWAVSVIEAKLTRNVEMVGNMDPYVIIKVDGKELRTKTMDNAGKTPVWNQDFDINLPDKKRDVTFQVWDVGTISDEIIGEATLKLESILTQSRDVKEIDIKHKGKSAGKLYIMSSISEPDTGKLDDLIKQLAVKDQEIADLKS